MERRTAFTGSKTTFVSGREDYVKRLREAGFKVEEVDMLDMLGATTFERYSLGEERWVYFVTKP